MLAVWLYASPMQADTSVEAGRLLRHAVWHGEPITVHVTVALCDNEQIACGDGGLGNPGNLHSNLYWGAMFGAKRIFERKDSGWTRVVQHAEIEGVLSREVYRRQVPGGRWSLPGRTVEQLVVLDAVHGAHINRAVAGFFLEASDGATLTIDDGDQRRALAVSVAGYAGHNRLMDGMRLPDVDTTKARAPIPSFVLACLSDRFFGAALHDAGSSPVVMTRSFMAPEGYVVEAAARAFGDNLPDDEIRSAVVAAYAKWQRISEREAARVFTP